MDAWSTIVERLQRCSSAANLTIDEESLVARADFDRSGRAEADAVWQELSVLQGVTSERAALSLTFTVSAT
jgi:hypothetical protein